MDIQALREELIRRRRIIMHRSLLVITALIRIHMLFIYELLQTPLLPPRQPYHTSALTGAQWVMELLTGHPRRIRTELGVSHHVFNQLLLQMEDMGMGASRHVTLEEQLAIFLYMSVTGSTIRHTGERFQRSNDTISRYDLFI
ncbi:hypothetical protein HWV62_17922 [Athelia sp. TMB]|nr:hypothetical protein HWV62_39231 [Athelia sp. TMB]KAF7967944.1 hypothetical protein HWV62_32483 [Athelia sp. TMB]KAF7972447.1 hypothetical protein HWV62_17922 [Athelia sp. TMB]